MRPARVVVLAAAICAALALSASLTVAKGGGKAKLVGPVSQPPLSFGQATVELKVTFGHRGKKLVPKSFLGKERNLYIHCADGTDGYPTDGGTGDATMSSHVDIESTVFVKKNGTFNHTDTNRATSTPAPSTSRAGSAGTRPAARSAWRTTATTDPRRLVTSSPATAAS